MSTEDWDRLLAPLNYREREIMKCLYGIGGDYTYTYAEIGRIYRITSSRVRQIERDVKNKISENPEDAALLASLLDQPVGRAKNAVKSAIDNAREVLSDREYMVVCRYYGLDRGAAETLVDISSDMGLTAERVRQIKKEALGKVQDALKEADPKTMNLTSALNYLDTIQSRKTSSFAQRYTQGRDSGDKGRF